MAKEPEKKQKGWGDLSLVQKATWVVKKVEGDLTSQTGEISVPKGYDLKTALKFAAMDLVEKVDKNGKPALEVCSPVSIANAIAKMAADGLYVHRNHCYFLVRNGKLYCEKSYHGYQMQVKGLDGVTDIRANVIREGDVFETKIENGQRIVTNHESPWDSTGKIKGAYCLILGEGDKIIRSHVMTKDKIDTCWSHSPSIKKEVHKEFPEDMCVRTVINHTCKRYLDTFPQFVQAKEYNEEEEITITPESVETGSNVVSFELEDNKEEAILCEPEEVEEDPENAKELEKAKEDDDEDVPF